MKLVRFHFLNFKFLFLISSIALISCNSNTPITSKDIIKNEYDEIKFYFETKQNYQLNNNIKTIFVLTDVGCMPCNKHFSNLITENLNNSSSIFLILASSTNIDLTEFKKSRNNVFFDKQENLNIKNLKKSKVLFLKNNNIDTSIIIDARQIDLQFREINERLKRNK